MSEIELKTCPFCGGKTYSQKLPFQPDTKYFRCGREAPDRSIIDGTGCGAIISFVGEQGNVPTEKFNTRTATARIAELEAERDALRVALDEILTHADTDDIDPERHLAKICDIAHDALTRAKEFAND